MSNLLAAEWLKLRTTYLLHGMASCAVALSSAAVAASVLTTGRAGISLRSTKALRRVLPITGTGAVLVLVLGILISAGEYRHGTAVDTFLTTPRRHRVVVAKLIVGGCVGLAVGLVTAVGCVAIAALLYGLRGVAFPFLDSYVWLTLGGAIVYTALFGVLGVGLGTLVRNQLLAVAGALAWIAIVEHILVNFAPRLGRWLPVAAGQAILRTPLKGLVSPLAGVGLLVGYSAAVTAIGIRLAATRDA